MRQTNISAWLPTDAQLAKRSLVASLLSTSLGSEDVPGTSNPSCCLAGTTPVSVTLPDGLNRPSRKLLTPGLPEGPLRPFMQPHGSKLTRSQRSSGFILHARVALQEQCLRSRVSREQCGTRVRPRARAFLNTLYNICRLTSQLPCFVSFSDYTSGAAPDSRSD